MFKKLKIKLTVINLFLVSIVLLIIFSSIYTLMKSEIDLRTKITMAGVARRERVIPMNFGKKKVHPPEGRRFLSNCFYIKIDKKNNVLEMSSNTPITLQEGRTLVKDTMELSKKSGYVSSKDLDLKYLVYPKTYGNILVYLDKNPDTDVLDWLVIISFIIGGISLILVFSISLFLANKALVPIKTAWEKQRAFVADASHELRTPLAVLNTSLEIVLDNPTETIESQSHWLENIQSEVTRMSRLVEELLFLARSDSESDIAAMCEFNVSNSLEQTCQLFKPFADENGINLKANIEKDIFMYGNESHIKQLVTILLDNAIKYTPKEGNVTLSIENSINSILIKVSDTGIGISKEYQDKIFERFFKADKARTRNDNGAGLGLSIAELIVKEHKGNISFAANTPTGTVFKVAFPLI